VEGRVSNGHFLYSYLTYIRLKIAIQRNLLLIDSLRQFLPDQNVEEGRKITKPQDLVRLYDIIIQVSKSASSCFHPVPAASVVSNEVYLGSDKNNKITATLSGAHVSYTCSPQVRKQVLVGVNMWLVRSRKHCG
jgi:hypothetical protein